MPPTLSNPTLATLLSGSTKTGVDVPATLIEAFKDIPAGTKALLTVLQGAHGKAAMVHIAWRTLAPSQPSDVMTMAEVETRFDMIQGIR